MGHQEIRASQLTGAAVAGSSGSGVGTISDIIVNPVSGRIDFAVLSLSAASSTGAATSPSGTSSSSGTSSGLGSSSAGSGTAGSSAAAAGGKQVAVPWMLLHSSSAAGAATATSITGQQLGFVFTGDTSKLESAPNFDATTNLSEPGWRSSVFSYFGLSGGGSATGGAETPGGSSHSSSLPETSSGSPK